MFIAFDGIDGCGKSTQVKMLCEYLRDKGHKVTELDMGNAPFFSKYLQAIKDWELVVPKEIRELIYYFEAIHTNINVIQKAELNEVIIIDRYYLSYLSYGSLNGVPENEIKFFIQNLIEPDYYFYLDCSPQISMDRIKKYREIDFPEIGQANEVKNMDRQFIMFQSEVKKKYEQFLKENHIRIDASLSQDSVFEVIKNAIQ